MTNHWLVRIILMVFAVAIPMIFMLVGEPEMIGGNNALAITYGLACVAVVGIENIRRGSSAVASGFVPTAQSVRLTLIGVAWALLTLCLILIVTLSFGGHLRLLEEPRATITGLSSIVLFAIGEEVVFRGTILEALRERFGPTAAIVITGSVFSLAHVGNPGASMSSMINVALVGIALGITVVTTSSLWMAIGFHVVWNIAVAAVFGTVSGLDMGLGLTVLETASLPPFVQPWISGPFGVEEGLLTGILLCAAMPMIARYAPYDPYVRAARYRRSFTS